MSETVITVEGLSKAYRIGMLDEVPDTLIGAAASWITSPWRNFQRLRRLNTFESLVRNSGDQLRGEHEQESNGHSSDRTAAATSDIIWALDNVSFEVKRGQVVGVIGRNGAGKSTLLKVLSRITEPTCGRAVIHGRVSSLLEVGTGFHAELSGRENVYLNGTILGMTKREIDRKFDQIVEFSGVQKFLDTPIKHYSSGMKVRLAFAVAAHLEPEILIIDEVLAVGDAEFQQKCLGKMQDVAQSGRTVLFVSHNAGALRSLCDRGILLENGCLTLDGPLPNVLNSYLDQVLASAPNSDLLSRTDRGGRGEVRISNIEIIEPGRCTSGSVSVGERVQFIFHLSQKAVRPQCNVRIFDSNGLFIAHCDTRLQSPDDELPPNTSEMLICECEEMLLMPGRYRMDVSLFCNNVLQDQVPGAACLEVSTGRVRGRRLKEHSQIPIVALPHRWIYSNSVASPRV